MRRRRYIACFFLLMVRFVAAPALADRMVFAGIAVLTVLPERTGLENFREADLREVFLPRDIGLPTRHDHLRRF